MTEEKKATEAAKENKSENEHLEYGCSIGDMLKAKDRNFN